MFTIASIKARLAALSKRKNLEHLLAVALFMPGYVLAQAVVLPVTGPVCSFFNTITGPIAAAIAAVVVLIGAFAIANGKSNMTDFIGTAMVGLGIAAVAVNVIQMLGFNWNC